MIAARWHGPGDVRVEGIPTPRPGPGDVLARVQLAGLCGTDVREVLNGPIAIPLTPHPLTGAAAPLTLGHEFCGEVVETGPDVSRVRPGDRVVADGGFYCTCCGYCRRGDYNRCQVRAFLGLSADGAFAEYVLLRDYQIHRLDAAVPDELGVLVEPVAVAVHALRRARFRVGETALVSGAGPVGLCLLQVLRAAGARLVVVSQRPGLRADRAAVLGATRVVDRRAPDAVDRVQELTDGQGVDVAFECAGAADSLETCLQASRKGGRTVVVGLYRGSVPANLHALYMGEREIVASRGYAHDYPTAIALVTAGAIRIDGLVTRRLPLAEIMAGVASLATPDTPDIKILLDPKTGS